MNKKLTKTAAFTMSICMMVSAVPTTMVALAADTYPGDNAVKGYRARYTASNGTNVYVDCVRDNNSQVWLTDKNIRVIQDAETIIQDVGTSVEMIIFPADKNPLRKDSSTWDTKAQILHNTEKVYNIYKNTLGHKNYDFSGSGDQKFYVFEFDDIGNAGANIKIDNYGNCPDEYINLLYFGKAGQDTYSMGTDIDVVGHEFTHLIVNQKLGWWPKEISNETHSLMEAYCDIMGELCEDEPDWMVAADVFKDNTASNKIYSLRNMKDPQYTNNKLFENVTPIGEDYEFEDFSFYKNYDDYKRNTKWLEENYKYGSTMNPNYYATTIIDHAAYLMYQGGISKGDLAQIWYKSMDYYTGDTKNATFIDCRKAVVKAAESYFRNSPKKVEIVNKAFDDVKVKTHNTKLSQATAAVTTNMHDFCRIESYKLPNNTYWNTGNPSTSSRTAIANDMSSYLPMGPTALKNFVNSYWQVQEPYYQCAGFAKKLQCDYFGTNAFVQISDNSYIPEIGDHLRVERFYKGRSLGEHSVFIRTVNSNSITFADCNSDGNNIIKWNNTVNTYRDSAGRLCYKIGGCTYQFVWAERPIKLGDANADGILSNDDLKAMDNIINGNISYRMYDGLLREYTADINGDHTIDSTDKTILSQLINNKNSARNIYGFVVY